MPRYRFHVHDGIDRPDPEGMDLVDICAARSAALRLASDVIRDAAMHAALGMDWSVTVTDDADLSLFVMTLVVSEAPAVAKP